MKSPSTNWATELSAELDTLKAPVDISQAVAETKRIVAYLAELWPQAASAECGLAAPYDVRINVRFGTHEVLFVRVSPSVKLISATANPVGLNARSFSARSDDYTGLRRAVEYCTK